MPAENSDALLQRGLRPTQVVRRMRKGTQAWARTIYLERGATGERRWDGVAWWSFHRPGWTIYGLWACRVTVLGVQELSMDHPAVQEAKVALARR